MPTQPFYSSSRRNYSSARLKGGHPMATRMALACSVITVLLVATACGPVERSSSTPLGPSTPSPIPSPTPQPAPQPTFVRWVSVAVNDSIRPSSAWGLSYGSSQQGVRNQSLERCNSFAGGSGCGHWLECGPNMNPNRPFAALAMSPWSSTFPVGRTGNVACANASQAEAESVALTFCPSHARTGACRIEWSGSMQ